ncbi:MAG: hypothetical protein ANIMEMIM_00134 [Candidatus Argoarchaeum ethanivorans]|uniref:CopG family transcriptional regulator n=1 Tax=Candidatus Argoarchaeum ethanivorans TaxID=2608793 RepID=A0A811TJI1_9EURY|nr:MAG: hypothetical protein KFBDDELM_00124 [Candidatus Argoarchaeum ethanivorans]CAD6491462.1 MAG: hypothetical protein ANIMEMIM_00134 [Candidatus Argoarchaeum ethanivorans]CAD6494996.1 MAG: hypothetical protein EMLJLAPB_01081 [Candidatus Argoarchaeum ethanivorans]
MQENRHTKRVQVSFTEKQWDLIQNLQGEMGNSDSDIVRSIIISWLTEKSFISTSVKKRMGEKND